MLMKKIFTLMAAMLVCVSGMMAAVGGKLRIPAMEHITAIVTRGGATLANGDSVWSGDVLNIRYVPDAHYCMSRTREFFREKTVTLKDNDFCQDWTNLANGESQGFTKCTAGGSSYEDVGIDGWKHQMPSYSYTSTNGGSSSTYKITPGVSGTVKVSFVRGLNNDFADWGKFKLYWTKNDAVQSSAVRDFTNGTYNRPGYTLFYDTIEVTLTATDAIGFVCEKVANNGWADDGRWWYIGSIHLLGGGDYYIEPMCAEKMYEVRFQMNDHIEVTASIQEDGTPIANGDYAPWDRHLIYSFQPSLGYKFSDNSTEEQSVIQLNDGYSGYNKTDKFFTISCSKTAEQDLSQRFPLVINLADHLTLESISVDGAAFNSGDSVLLGQVLYYRIKADDGWCFLDKTTVKEVTVTLTQELVEVDGSDKRITITTEAPEQIQQYTLIFNLAEHVSLDSTSLNGALYNLGDNVSTGDQLYYRFRTDDGWIFSDATTVKENTVTIAAALADADKKITINSPAAQQIIYYTLIFDIPEHASLKSVKINGADWDGGPVLAGNVVDYEFVAEKHYKFEDLNDDYLGGSNTIYPDMANENNEIIISCPAAIFAPGVKIQFVATTHSSLKYAKLNGVDYDGGYAWNGDTIDFAFVADKGYDFYEITHEEGVLELGAQMEVDESMADADGIVKYECPPVSLRPEYVVFVPEVPHTTCTLKVNSQPIENGGNVYPGDTLFFRIEAEEGYAFEYSGSTFIEDKTTISRGMTDNDTILITGFGEVKIQKPLIMVNMLDSTTARISWTGIFTESKILVTPVELMNADPRYAKGFTFVNERELVIDTLTPGVRYYVYVIGLKPEMSDVAYVTFDAIYTEKGGGEWNLASTCTFTINMYDEYGDGWNGCGLRFVEAGNEQTITLPDGEFGTATYESTGEEVQIYWVKGSYQNEVSAIVTDQEGSVVLSIGQGQASDYVDGQLLFSGVLCDFCHAKIEDIIYDADSTNFLVSWTGVDAVSYDVIVTQKSYLTTEEVEGIMFHQDSTSYFWKGEKNKGYNVYVRGICADGIAGAWSKVFVYEPIDNPEPYARLHAKSIEFDYTEEGDLLINAAMGGPSAGTYFPILAYRVNLADTTDAVFSFEWKHLKDYNDTYGVVLRDTAADAPMEQLQYFERGDTLRNLIGDLYILVLNEGQLDEYTLKFTKPKYLVAKPIEPDYTETGDFTEAVSWSTPYMGAWPTVLYSYTPTDSVADIVCSVTTESYSSTMMSSPSIFYFIFRDTLDNSHIIYSDPANFGSFSRRVEKGHTYYIAISLNPTNGKQTDDYTIHLSKIAPLAAKTITPDYIETGDYTDATEWIHPYFGTTTYSKAYVYTPSDTTEVLLTVNGNNAPSGAGIFLYKNEITGSNSLIAEAAPTIGRMTCYKDSTYILVLSSLPMYGGNRTDTYELRIEEIKEETVPTVTAVIEPDTIVRDVLTTEDYVSEADALIKVYEYVAYQDEKVSMGLFINDTIAGIGGGMMYMPFYAYVYKDTLELYGSEYSSFSGSFVPITLTGSEEGTHYYIVISGNSSMALTGLPFNLHFRREIDYNASNVRQTVKVGQRYTSEMTLFDEYTYHSWPGSAETFEFHAEKGKKYKILMHSLEESSVNNLCISVLDPSRKTGTYNGNLVSTYNGSSDGWCAIEFAPDSTGNYVLMFDHYLNMNYMMQDALSYEFLISEYIEFFDMINQAEYVDAATPYNESGVFTSASTKVLFNAEYSFHAPSSFITAYGGLYNAKAYMVIVPAGQDLFVEYGSQKDVIIQIYDFATASTAHSPQKFDEIALAYPYEVGYYHNSESVAKMVYVVVSQYDVELGDDEWSLRIGLGEATLETAIAKGVASQDKITIYNDQDEMDAVAALGALQLSAIDAATGATIGTISNNSAYWRVDLVNNKARFEVNDSDLPVGYRFAEATEWIEVEIEVLPYSQGIDDLEGEQRVEIRKFLYNGQIYIQTPQGIFNITGQRVR